MKRLEERPTTDSLRYTIGQDHEGNHHVELSQFPHDETIEEMRSRYPKVCGGQLFLRDDGVRHISKVGLNLFGDIEDVSPELQDALENSINEHLKHDGIPKLKFTRGRKFMEYAKKLMGE